MSWFTQEDKLHTEEDCIAFLEEQRWGKDAENRYCPHCGSLTTYKFKNGWLYKCADCHKQFTVRVGTIFSDSHLPLRKWFRAAYILTAHKKGISSVQLAKDIEVTQKTAWFVLQRLRHSFAGSGNDLLSGVIEVDESYFGGVRRGDRRGPADKAAVFGIVERGGKVRLKYVKSTGERTLTSEISKSVKLGTVIYSDQYGSYRTLSRRGYIHDTVNHASGEFGRGVVHTNTIEGGVWSHLKKSLGAIYIHVSRKHLQKYLAEFEYRYNSRQLTDERRFNDWLTDVNGKRLTYRQLIG